jgi:hypothetical protein
MNLKTSLTREQWKYLSSVFKTIAEAMVLGSSAAYFLPETLQTTVSISSLRYIAMLWIGLCFLIFGAILVKRGEESNL